jgi:hypothetical protein
LEELNTYKVKMSPELGLLIESQKTLTTEEIQPILDSSLLHQKAHLEHERAIDKQHQIYTLMIAGLVALGLFSISFATVRTISKFTKTSGVENHARIYVS